MSDSHSTATQHEAIRHEYRRQAPRWGGLEIDEHLRWLVERLPLTPRSTVVDVAAGTGLFSRAIARSVASVTAVDITPEMIDQGRKRAEESRIQNIVWRQGAAEALPFEDGCFDLAVTRYSLHHMVDPVGVLKEMGRVCGADGTIVAVDMVSDEDREVADRQDALERLMDRTHTHVLSPSGLVRAAADAGLTLERYLSRDVPRSFDDWQGQVPADSPDRIEVRKALEAELAGGRATGMRPLVRDGGLWFTHVWGVLVAGKAHRGLAD